MASETTDIRKKAMLVKIKTNKKKLFILREESSSGPARLEYYDNEKKFKTGVSPKRCIVLKNCFSINAKSDARHQHAVILYTKDDCFGVAFDTDTNCQEWLSLMLDLRSQSMEDSTLTRPLFEHIWPVTVKAKGLSGNRDKGIPPGSYRLCLTNTDVSLIRLYSDKPDVVVPLDVIRRCGHSHEFFFLELGRSAVTGSGELWLQVEDTVIAQNMHEAILNAMKNNTFTVQPHRPRTHSSTDKSNKRHRPSQPQMSRSHSISVHNKDKPSCTTRTGSVISATVAYDSSPQSVGSGSDRIFGVRLDSDRRSAVSSLDDIDTGYPSSGAGSTRSITPEGPIQEEPSDGEYFSMNPQLSFSDVREHHPAAEDTGSYLLFKPAAMTTSNSDYMSMPGVLKAGVMEAGSCATDLDRSSKLASSHAAALSSSAGLHGSDYMAMATHTVHSSKVVSEPGSKKVMEASSKKLSTGSRGSDESGHKKVQEVSSRKLSTGSRGGDDYMSMQPHNKEDYVDMKSVPRHCTDEALHGSGSSVSSVVSQTSGTVSSSVVSSRSGITERSDVGTFHSLSRLQEISTDGYMEMSSQLPTGSDQIGRHLQVVHSYFHEDDAVDSSLQKRAYSVGSKPPTGKPHSSGSYVDMSVGASAGLQHSLKDEAEKSCSAPHLNDEACRPQSGVVGKEVADLFMELDFNRKSDAVVVKDFRTRASSSGARDFSQRKLSHNAKDALSRITFFHRGGGGGNANVSQDAARRPRTSTICQESLRPRTSSFGTSDDSRPRSSSGGNARFRDVFGADSLHGVRHFAQRRLTNKRPSVESSADSLAAGAEYLDMMCGSCSRSSAVQTAPTQQQSDPYMVMRPGNNTAKSTDNSESTKSRIPAGDRSRVIAESAICSCDSQPASVVDSTGKKSTDVVEEPTTAATSREVNPPVPFEVGISFQTLHYTATCPGTSAAAQVACAAVAITVSSATDSIATQCSTDVSYATLDLHSGTVVPTMVDTLARPTEPLYHGAVHAYAEIDFSQSDKK